jgi:hypothetical protein
MKLIPFIILISLLFFIYVELSVGNVFIRINSEGKKCFNISSVFQYMIEPLKNRFLWNIELLDVNYVFIISTSIMLYYSI